MIILKIAMNAPVYAPIMTCMDASRLPLLSAPSLCPGQQCSCSTAIALLSITLPCGEPALHPENVRSS